MRERIELFGTEQFLSLNAKLQQKKNKLREMLKEKGILTKDKENKFDRYKYFSEAQYKLLFTELFAVNQLELSFSEKDYRAYTGSEKQSQGRLVNLEFCLTDCETGFYETTVITGDALDKGDKAGYKAYTGALKYYLANTFMVATEDDAEKDSPKSTKPVETSQLSEAQLKRLYAIGGSKEFSADEVKQICLAKFKVEPKALNKKNYDALCEQIENNSQALKDWLGKVNANE